MEEVSLRELIEILIRRKRVIIFITVVALITSGVLSFFVLPPVYEATATLQVDLPAVPKTPEGNSPLEALLQSLAVASHQASLETYRYQVTNPTVLERVQKKLALDPQVYSLQALANIIKVENPKNTNLLEIHANNSDARLARDLANTVAQEYIAFMQDLQAQRLNQVSSTIEAQQNKEEEKLNQVMEEYRQFLAQPRSVKQLNAELEAKVQLLTEFKTNLRKTQVELEGTRRALEAAETKLAGTPATLKTVKVVGDDPLLLNITESKTGRPSQEVAGLKLEDEEPNPIYLSLATQANTYRMQVAQLQEKVTSLQEQIRSTEKELQALQEELAEKQLIDDKYQVQIKNLQENFRSLLIRSEEARVAGSLDTSVQTRLIAPAVEPSSPVRPRKLLNTAVATLLGLMVGVLAAFFLEMWNAPVPGIENIKG
jgi:capsular polysaccharide biosynthesis protein